MPKNTQLSVEILVKRVETLTRARAIIQEALTTLTGDKEILSRAEYRDYSRQLTALRKELDEAISGYKGVIAKIIPADAEKNAEVSNG